MTTVTVTVTATVVVATGAFAISASGFLSKAGCAVGVVVPDAVSDEGSDVVPNVVGAVRRVTPRGAAETVSDVAERLTASPSLSATRHSSQL